MFLHFRCHHQLKTFGGWHGRQLADGTVIWQSPTGQSYRTSPSGDDLFPQLQTPACAPPAPNRRSPYEQRSARIARVASVIASSGPSTKPDTVWSKRVSKN